MPIWYESWQHTTTKHGVARFNFRNCSAKPVLSQDRKGLPPTAPEDTASVEESVHNLVKLLDKAYVCMELVSSTECERLHYV